MLVFDLCNLGATILGIFCPFTQTPNTSLRNAVSDIPTRDLVTGATVSLGVSSAPAYIHSQGTGAYQTFQSGYLSFSSPLWKVVSVIILCVPQTLQITIYIHWLLRVADRMLKAGYAIVDQTPGATQSLVTLFAAFPTPLYNLGRLAAAASAASSYFSYLENIPIKNNTCTFISKRFQ